MGFERRNVGSDNRINVIGLAKVMNKYLKGTKK